MGVPVPLYSVPETHLPGTGGGIAVTEAPGGMAWEGTQQTHPPPGEDAESQETVQRPDGQKAVSTPQVPPIPRAHSPSEGSTALVKEDERESSDEADETSSQNTTQGEKRSGFGWFSWFRSKPPDKAAPSGDEDSPDSPDSEPQPLPATGTFSTGTGRGDVRGPASSWGTAEGTGSGGLSGPEGVSSELYFSPGVLLPPPPMKGAVPLYNPAQVPQLPVATSLNRPNRLAQRRYPTQP